MCPNVVTGRRRLFELLVWHQLLQNAHIFFKYGRCARKSLLQKHQSLFHQLGMHSAMSNSKQQFNHLRIYSSCAKEYLELAVQNQHSDPAVSSKNSFFSAFRSILSSLSCACHLGMTYGVTAALPASCPDSEQGVERKWKGSRKGDCIQQGSQDLLELSLRK